jgi:YbbR domain-containing protein
MLRTRTEWLKTKFLLQAVALVVALVAWLLVNSGQTVHQRRSVRLQYLNLPKDFVFQRTPLKEAKVDLTGSLYRLRAIPEEDFIYPIDLSNAKAGIVRVDLDLDNLRLPVDIEAAHINPRSFNVHLEEIYSQSVKIRPTFLGSPKEGFQLGTVKMKPEYISVSGPRSLVSKLNEVELEISLIGRELSFSETLKPRLSFINPENIEPVLVEVEITHQRSRQEFSSVSVVASSQNSKVKILPAKGKVVLEGADPELRAIEPTLQVRVPVEGLRRGRYRLRGQVALPQKVKLISIEPESFLVEVLQEGAHK